MVAVKTDDRPILILGAGINGAALARELILNDFPVCVVDQGDLAGGTTAWSSRLIHGGLRYLEYSEFDLVRESLRERNLLLKLAPQFVRPLRLYVPTSNRFGGLATSLRKFFHFQRKKPSKRDIDRGLWLIRMGLHFYDAYAQDEVLPKHDIHRLNDPGVAKVDPEQYRWLCSYSDAQIVFPERFVAALLIDAAEEAQRRGISFEMFNYHEAWLDGRQVTIRARDNKTPGEEEASTGPVVREFEPVAIVNATGAWVDLTLKRLEIPSRRLMGGTKGSHFVTSHQGLRDALKGQGIYAEAADDRPVFVLPLGKDYTLVGTTDVRYTGNPGKAIPTDEELDYLVDTVNHIVPGTPLTRDDIDFHYAGVRPLPYTDATTTASITRRHWLERADHAEVPTYSVIGGKLTTCRSLAEESAHEIAKLLRPESPYEAKSIDRPIPGGENYPSNKAELEATWERLAAESCFDRQQIESMWQLCGTRVRTFLSQDGQLSSELLVGTDLPLDFVRWSIRNEWVQRVDDLVERRLMLLYQPSLSEATLRRLGDLLIEERGISQEQADSQVQATIDRLREHFGKRLTATAIE